MKSKGTWAYLYRAVDPEGQPSDFLLPPHRERAGAEAFLHKAIQTPGLPEKMTLDKRGANTAASTRDNQTPKTASVLRPCQYLKNIGEQDQRAGNRLPRPLLGFNSFWAACGTSAGSEVMQAIRKGQRVTPENVRQTLAEQL